MNFANGASANIVVDLNKTIWYGLSGNICAVISRFLNCVFPIRTNICLTPEGRISTKNTLTPMIEQVLIAKGAIKPKPRDYPIGNTVYSLQPDFSIQIDSLIIAIESQFGQRECTFYDILKHAELQRQGKTYVLVELIPDDDISKKIPASASFSWFDTMWKTILCPCLISNAVRAVIVPVSLQ
jgi:hypothetical protein